MSDAPEFVPLSVEELQEYFPQYQILSFIAAGGMGAVYLANQNSIDRKVAIKVLPREMSSDEEFSTQFRAEAKVMSRMNHPNLIGFFDFGEVDGMLFIVMEFVDGKSLHHSAHGEAIEQDTALELALGLALGVEHAHKAGILHRDIKPANILLDQNAFPKLGDFGLARPVEESEEGKVIFGTPGYTAPEVVDNPAAIDERSDIYSIGAILYELLTSYLPQEVYKAPSQVRDVDPAFDKVVQKAISFDPDLRYSDMGSFISDLKKIKLFHERGHTAPTQTTPITAPKAEHDKPGDTPLEMPSSKLMATGSEASGSGRPSVTPYKPKKSNNTMMATSLAAVLILLGLIWAAVTLFTNKKEEAAAKASPSKSLEVVKPITVTPKKNPPSKTASPPIKAKSPIQELEELAHPLANGDFSDLPAGTIVDTASMRAFFLYSASQTWHDASKVAKKFGGYLACADTSLIRANLVGSMKTHNTDTVWLGGGTAGEAGITWVNGKPWNFPDVTSSTEGVISMADTGFLKCEDPEQKKAFFIGWNLEGYQEGTLSRQLNRLKKTANDEEPIVPPGAVLTKNNIYYLLEESMSFSAAVKQAERVNAQLASPTGAVEHAYLSSLVLNSVPVGQGAWLNCVVKPAGGLSWGNGKKPKLQRWIESPTMSGEPQAVQLVNGETLGWKAYPQEDQAYATLLEWTRGTDDDMTSEPEKDVTKVDAPPMSEYEQELVSRAKAANASRREEKMEKLDKNIASAKWAISQWMRGLSADNRVLIEHDVEIYFEKAENKTKLYKINSVSKIPSDGKVVIKEYIEKQEEINLNYRAELLKLKSAMGERLKSKGEEEIAASNTEAGESLSAASKRYSNMSEKGFQNFLLGKPIQSEED